MHNDNQDDTKSGTLHKTDCMTEIPSAPATFRIRKYYRKGDLPKKYTYTFEVADENTRQVVAICDLTGKACFSTLAIMDSQGKSWQMKPNRKIMPSRWVVTDPAQTIAAHFDQKILGKLSNPLYKTVLVILDCEGNEVHRLIDPRTNIPDRILGLGPNDWALMEGDKLVARLTYLRRGTEPPKGIFGKFKELFAGTDWGVVSVGTEPILPAPVALAMLMLFDELTDRSVG